MRLLIYGVQPTIIGWALAAQLLHGGTFALPWAAGVIGAARLSQEGLGTVGQGLFSAFFVGLGPIVGFVVAGYLLDQGTEQSIMGGVAMIVLVGTALVTVPLLWARNI